MRAEIFELIIRVAGFQFLKRCDARRHGQRISAQRAGLVNAAQWREAIHDFRAPSERADGQAAANDFAEATQVRLDAETFLRAAKCKAESSHHFVENQQGAVSAVISRRNSRYPGFGR